MGIIADIVLSIVLLLEISVGANAFSLKTPFAAQQIRGAMKLTTEGQSNITAAHLAVSMWSEILEEGHGDLSPTDMKNTGTSTIQPSIRVLCNPLYASSLSRIGRDRDAIRVYEATLSLIETMKMSIDDNVLMDVRVGKAESLQRLICYEAAAREFLAASNLGQKLGKVQQEKAAKCVYSASICFLRQGDLRGAESLLFPIFREVQDLSSIDSNLVGLYGSVRFEIDFQTGKHPRPNEEQRGIFFTPIQMLEHAASSDDVSPIYRWLYAVASKSSCNFSQSICSARDGSNAEDKDEFLRIASINQSPFDDPALINLDDKILLHDLLKTHKQECCWPDGFVLPRDEAMLLANYGDSRWMSKERAGYGSHGNKVTTAIEAIAQSRQNDGDSMLCQKLIEPSLLLDKRKFSVRIYVIYFHQGGRMLTYLLNDGLVKLAEAEYDLTTMSDDIYMTNSGRIEGDAMTQHDLHYLQQFLENEYGSEAYHNFWRLIEDSVTNVARVFRVKILENGMKNDDNYSSLFSSVPKICGFDYIVDSSRNPVLLEVNRFPGLEARGNSDYIVKLDVVRTAWILASALSKIDSGFKQKEMEDVHSKCILLSV